MFHVKQFGMCEIKDIVVIGNVKLVEPINSSLKVLKYG